jgi:ferrous iron transport protein B
MSNLPTIVIAGNPNCGKTALFNALTGSHQRVGNWPGVTVERKTGVFCQQQQKIRVVDLPGVYSLNATADSNSLDEKIACEYLLSGEPQLIVNVLDATNLERNLFLTTQLLELNLPVILAVNMLDIIHKRGIEIDLQKLSAQLNCPVVGVVASRGKGVHELKDVIVNQCHALNFNMDSAAKPRNDEFSIRCPHLRLLPTAVKQALTDLQQQIAKPHAEWLALRLLEEDALAAERVSDDVKQHAAAQIKKIALQCNEDPDILIADARYRLASDITLAITRLFKTRRQTFTEALDKIVLNKWLGLPIFLLMMYLMFLFAINIGGAFQDLFDIGSSTLFVNGAAHLLMQWHAPAWLIALIANGVGSGINTTITFAPVIGGMFLFLSFLEDSGYMARAAFVMDRLMHALGLPGKSFVPMIVGFGCNVPAVMGARTIAHRRDRILAVMMMPFMSCGARLAIFAVFAAAFFPNGGASIIFALYIIGIVVAVLTGLLLRKTALPGDPAPLVMELPPYHLPQLKSLLRHAWQRLKKFLTKAGRFIVPICVLISGLNAINIHGELIKNNHSQHSILSTVGKTITPVFTPMGIKQENWPATVGLMTGVLAKEVVVATLNSLYMQVGHFATQAGSQFDVWRGLKAAVMSVPQNLRCLGAAFANPLKANEAPHDMNHQVFGLMYHYFAGKAGAFAYLLFILLYFPCVSTLAVMRREVGQRWAYFSVLWSTGSAYCLSVLCYQLLTIELHPVLGLMWLVGILLLLSMTVIGMRVYSRE